ncbi:histone-lysine N-methyltransferase PRDM9-like isoform X2 [Eleutherodactylus coqui]|uniref:histone-lysine N-methyltransferase PRDM9-like isoform X2 n=1 Tax=Eleutherodactylus coqui TaxID=57060 RepID=UPI00346373F9
MFSPDGVAPPRCLEVYQTGDKTEVILSLTLEMVYLLTGEEYGPVRSKNRTGSELPGQERVPAIHEGILQLTNKIIELLTDEDPDYTVKHKGFPKEMKERQTFQSMGVSSKRNTWLPRGERQVKGEAVQCDRPLHSKENPVDLDVVSQSKLPLEMGVEVKTENTNQDHSSSGVTPSLISSRCRERDLPIDYAENCINIVQGNIHPLLEDEILGKIKVEESSSNINEAKNTGNPFQVTILSHEEDKPVRLHSSRPEHTSYLNNSLDTAQTTGIASGSQVLCMETEDPRLMSDDKTRTGKKPFVCCECGKGFTRNTILVEHRRLHTGEKPYVCSICGQRFISNGQRIRHERLHSGEKPYICTECGKGFTRNSILVEHKRIHTGEKPFPCPECGKLFTTNSQLVKHIKYHKGEKPHECLDCGKRFISNGLLVIHQRSHTGEKPFVCPQCGKAFARNAILQEHMRIHYGEKPFECKECGKPFASNSDLRKHQRNHLGEKPHACPDCGKRFICNALLVIHYRSHTGEKPFVCKECGKCFAKKGSLVSHNRMHAGEKLSGLCPGV